VVVHSCNPSTQKTEATEQDTVSKTKNTKISMVVQGGLIDLEPGLTTWFEDHEYQGRPEPESSNLPLVKLSPYVCSPILPMV
jgi:hypothetical protein